MKIKILSVLSCLLLTAVGPAFGSSPRVFHFQSRWSKNLQSEDDAKADQAVLKLFRSGTRALPDLIQLVSVTTAFRGQFAFDDYDADLAHDRPTVGVVCMYLIQAICEQNLRFAKPRLEATGSLERVPLKVPPTLQEIASAAYTKWWSETQGLQSAGCDCLKGTLVRWSPEN